MLDRHSKDRKPRHLGYKREHRPKSPPPSLPHPRTAVEIRTRLLDRTLQAHCAGRLGHSNPHIELVGMASAIATDAQAFIPTLSLSTVKRCLNAVSSHLALLLLIPNPSAAQDVLDKATDVTSAAVRWAFRHHHYDALQEHIGALTFDLCQWT